MIDLAGAHAALMAELAEALDGIVAVVDDPAVADPPCLLVGIPELGPPTLAACSAELTVALYLLAAPPWDGNANKWLMATVPAVLEAAGAESAAPRTFANRLPCYFLTVSTYA